MENTKAILTKKKILDKSNPYPETIRKEKNKKSEQNPYLSESGATTTSSVSSNTKQKEANENDKTPKKNIFQNFPNKKNEKTISPDCLKRMNKIYSKGTIKNFPNKNKNNKKIINANNMSNTMNINTKQFNRSISLVNIENGNNNKNDLSSIFDKSITNTKKKNIYIIKKNKNKNLGNKKITTTPLNTDLNNKTTNDFMSNIYSDSENNFTRTENKKINPSLKNINNFNLTVNKNLEKSHFNQETITKKQLSPKNILNSYANDIIGKGYHSEAEKKTEKNVILNLEELLMTEEKLSSVINCLKDRKQCAEECFEWMNSYVQSGLIYHMEKYFIKAQYIKMIKVSININIFSLILSYMVSLNEILFDKLSLNLLDVMTINHRILILICKYFSNKIMERNLWVEKLHQLIHSYYPGFKNTFQIMEEINIFFNYLIKIIPNILIIYPNLELIQIYNALERLSSFELINIYREKFHKNVNQNGSIFASSSFFVNNKIKITNPKFPFLEKKSNKKYTLVLDLDETLIHFKPNPNSESSGKIMIRPFLYDFLRSVKKYYELIIFTAATEDYANPIINAIEKDEKFFEHRLYRMHTTVINNDFVKDLSKLGRDLNRTIIVDNMKQNYKNQPDNGITIRPFWGKDVEDTALVDLLVILKQIAENNMNVITGLKYFKEDIISKVSSNILRRAQNK